VPEQRYNQTKVSEYREAATKLHEALLTVEQRLDSAFENGIDQAVHDALAELNASGVALEKLRATLTPTDLFIAKYNIQVQGAHEVSFVLPEGISRYEMLSEAQGLVWERDLIMPSQLKGWENDSKFTAPCGTPERIQIDGHVEGGDGKGRPEQEAFLTGKGLTPVLLEDLAAAFAAHYIATGDPLFEWFEDYDCTPLVRAADGALIFAASGLIVFDFSDSNSNNNVAVAARVPRNSKN
jgi:hypothetical protein